MSPLTVVSGPDYVVELVDEKLDSFGNLILNICADTQLPSPDCEETVGISGEILGSPAPGMVYVSDEDEEEGGSILGEESCVRMSGSGERIKNQSDHQ